MIPVDLSGKTVLVTGGTRGLGRAIAEQFSRAGASVFVTHLWGSVPEEELAAGFEREHLRPPQVVECDTSDSEANRALMAVIQEKTGRLDAIVSNVAFTKIVRGLEEMKKSTLDLSLGYSAWPVVDMVQASQAVLGKFPRYVIGISSDGGQVCHEGYDLIGVAKSALETLDRYLAMRLKKHGVRVNTIRCGYLDTASSRAFGDELLDSIKKKAGEIFLDPRRVAGVCVALCSGLMDSVTGQVIVVDEGWSLVSPIAYLAGKGNPGEFPPDELP